MRVPLLSRDVEGEGFPRRLPSAPRAPPTPPHTHTQPWKGARGGAPESGRSGLGAGFQKIITVLKSETGSSVRRHRQAGSPARRAARREGAATRGRRRPPRRRGLQRAPWARRVPAPPCGLALAGHSASGRGRPAYSSLSGWLPTAYPHLFFSPSPTINLLGESWKTKFNQSTFRPPSMRDN